MEKRPVLAIDDEFYVTKAIHHMMEQDGVRCIIKTDPLLALDIIRAENPLVVVLDINMPGKDGLTLCKEIKSAYPGITIYLLTAQGKSEDVEAGLKCGAAEYITKPFSPTDLRKKIRAIYSSFYHS
ncbi:MAG: response regulator [Nitrospinae bacterium]|nr:response regulator [Nitrospinota bacterium]